MNIKTDVLIIGSGIAGLFAALKVSDFADVVLVTKKEKSESNTNYAQGGIASVLHEQDTFDKHINDTMIAGAGLCNRKTVEIMVNEGPERIKDLIEIGTEFTRKEGKLHLVKEGGHSLPRIAHAADLTGKEIERALIARVNNHKNIKVIENTIAIDLITEHNIHKLKNAPLNNRNCWGAYVLDNDKKEVIKISARATIIATGGVGQVYMHTTNPAIATGDGYAMAYRAGAQIGNMEFVQFHPTSFYNPNGGSSFQNPSFLISEAVRGYGGVLRTKDGSRFMQRYDERKELAPRDIVARAIDNELKKRGDEFVYLDVTHKKPEETIEHFPNIYKHCLEHDIDITKDFIPVVPAAHYACGGIYVDEFARTSLKGLYACGEVSMTGVHGANRLASNSLLEAVVFAERASINIEEFLKNYSGFLPEIPDWDDSGTLSADENILITHSTREVKQVMWDYVGIVRSDLRLERAAKRIHNIYTETEELYKKTKIFEEILGLRNIITCSHIIIKSAQLRKESRGLHYTLDYPATNPDAIDTILRNTNP
ncbi:MAG: L-aspartate oxidase [Ignavibacteriaceae bacterium]